MALLCHNEAGEFLASVQGLRLPGIDHSLKAAAVDVMASAVPPILTSWQPADRRYA